MNECLPFTGGLLKSNANCDLIISNPINTGLLKSDANHDMIISNPITTTTTNTKDCSSPTTLDSFKNGKKKKRQKSIIPKIFTSNRKEGSVDHDSSVKSDGDGVDLDSEKVFSSSRFSEPSPIRRKNYSSVCESQSSSGIEGLNLSSLEDSMVSTNEVQEIRIFVGTWNVGGKTPNNGLNLEDFLQVEGSSDIYVLGFQEIVPLSAGNILVIEDSEPATKWLALINQALNKPQNDSIYSSSDIGPGLRFPNNILKEPKSPGGLSFFQRPPLKALSKNLRADNRILKTCNCPLESPSQERWRLRKFSEPVGGKCDISMDGFLSIAEIPSSPSTAGQMNYRLVASKQMVGLFLSVWARKELVPHIGHLGISSVGRGIMGYLGNKGCISMSMSLHQTSFCFVCSHLASGEKEGDELKRNSDVVEILKSTQFTKICKNPNRRAPEKIIDHDRIIWLGDLNYRVALSYDETRVLLEDNDWDTLLEKDQLKIEKEAGRVFSGFSEGRILFAPTYKYTHNSDSYAGETVKSKKKRRTPAWCDRILWRGSGIEQLSYIRGESRLSDHRPVCAVFAVEVEVRNNSRLIRKGYTCASARLEYEDCIPQRHSFYGL